MLRRKPQQHVIERAKIEVSFFWWGKVPPLYANRQELAAIMAALRADERAALSAAKARAAGSK